MLGACVHGRCANYRVMDVWMPRAKVRTQCFVAACLCSQATANTYLLIRRTCYMHVHSRALAWYFRSISIQIRNLITIKRVAIPGYKCQPSSDSVLDLLSGKIGFLFGLPWLNLLTSRAINPLWLDVIAGSRTLASPVSLIEHAPTHPCLLSIRFFTHLLTYLSSFYDSIIIHKSIHYYMMKYLVTKEFKNVQINSHVLFIIILYYFIWS